MTQDPINAIQDSDERDKEILRRRGMLLDRPPAIPLGGAPMRDPFTVRALPGPQRGPVTEPAFGGGQEPAKHDPSSPMGRFPLPGEDIVDNAPAPVAPDPNGMQMMGQGLAEYSQPMESPHGLDPTDILSPQHWSLGTQAARQVGLNNDLNSVMKTAYSGVSPDEQRLMRERDDVTRKIEDLFQRTKDLPTPEFDALMQRLQGMGAEMSGLKPPQKEKLPYDLATALGAGLAMAIDPTNAGQYAGAYGDIHKQREQEHYADQKENYESELQRRKLEYQTTQDQINLQAAKDAQLQKQADDAVNRELAALNLRGKTIEGKLEDIEKMRVKAETAYQSALNRNSPEGIRRAAAVLKAMGHPVEQDELTQAVGFASARASEGARAKFSAITNSLRDDFGGLSEDVAKRLDGQRVAIASEYGINIELLEPVVSDATLAKQRFDQVVSQFNQRFEWMQSKDIVTLAQAQVRLEQGSQRIALMERALQTNQVEAYWRMQHQSFDNQMALVKIAGDINGMAGGIQTPDTDYGKALKSGLESAKKEIAKLDVQITAGGSPVKIAALTQEKLNRMADMEELIRQAKLAMGVAERGSSLPGMPTLPVIPTPDMVDGFFQNRSEFKGKGGNTLPPANGNMRGTLFPPQGGGGKANTKTPVAPRPKPKPKTDPLAGWDVVGPGKK